jgi:hypothetical protein
MVRLDTEGNIICQRALADTLLHHTRALPPVRTEANGAHAVASLTRLRI